MKLILVSSSEKPEHGDDPLVKMFIDHSKEEPYLVTKMFENGLKTFHLRKASFSTKELTEYLDRIPKEFHSRIILHSHHKIASKYNIKGLNLSKRDKRNTFKTWIKCRFLRIRNPQAVLSTTFTRLSNLLDESKMEYDYVFINPVFDNLTGKFMSGITEDTLRSVLSRISHKVIARGGVTVDKVKQVQDIGFVGLAIHSIIWKKPDPVAEFILFKEKFKELGLTIE